MEDSTNRPVFLTLKEVMDIHEEMVRRYGGKRGIRDSALLESVLTMPRTGIVGQYLHEGVYEMASAYLFHFCRNRPFYSANDRTAMTAALVFLHLNGFGVSGGHRELADLVTAVVQQKADKKIVSWFLESHAHPLDEGPLGAPASEPGPDPARRDLAS